MKQRYIVAGLLVLAGSIFCGLLMIGGSGSLARAQEASLSEHASGRLPRQTVSSFRPSPPHLGMGVQAVISYTSSPHFVYLPFIARKGTNSFGDVSPNEADAQALSFGIELQAAPPEVNSGNDLEYIIRYTVNNKAASNVVITGSLPIIDQDCYGNDIRAYYRYSEPPADYSYPYVTWNLGTVAEGTTSEVKFVAWMPPDPLDGTTFTNQAFIHGDGSRATSEVVTVTLHTYVNSYVSTAPSGYVRPGDIFCVPIMFYNNGTSRDTNLVLNHQHPVETTFITATMPHTYQGNQVTWQQSCVPAGFWQRYITRLQAAPPPIITAGDVITHHFAYDTDLQPPWSQDRQQIVDLGPHASYNGWSWHESSTRASFSLRFNDDTSWPLDNLDFYVRVPISTTFVSLTENGDFRCVPPTITAQVSNDPALVIPPPLASPSWLPYNLGYPDPHPAPGTTWVHVQAGPIDWDQSFILTVDYTGLSGGTVITATGTYTSNQINGDVAIPFAIPAFWFYKYGPATANTTEDMNYSLVIQNVSGVTSYGVVVTDTLPVETTFITATGNASYDPVTHRVRWDLGQMDRGQQEYLFLTVNVKRGLLDKTTVRNQAEMTFAGYSGAPIQSTWTTLVRSHPSFQVTHQPEKRYVPSGGLITYTITYYNRGTGASNDALVTSLLPDKTVFVAATTPNGEQLSYDAAEVRWARPLSVPVDIAQMVQLVVRNDPPSPDGTIITNVVFISSSQSLLATGNLTTVTVGIEPTPIPTTPSGDDDERDEPPTPTSVPLPPPSPTPSPTLFAPLSLPETGQSGSGHRLVSASMIVGFLILVGLRARHLLLRTRLRAHQRSGEGCGPSS